MFVEKHFPTICANCNKFTAKVQKSICSEQTKTLTFTTTCLKDPCLSIEKQQLAKASLKSLRQSSCSSFAIWRLSSVLCSKESGFFPGRKSVLPINRLQDFVKAFDQGSPWMKNPLPTLKTEIGSKKSKDNLFVHYRKISLNIQIDIFVHSSDLKTTIFLSFPSKNLNHA